MRHPILVVYTVNLVGLLGAWGLTLWAVVLKHTAGETGVFAIHFIGSIEAFIFYLAVRIIVNTILYASIWYTTTLWTLPRDGYLIRAIAFSSLPVVNWLDFVQNILVVSGLMK